MSTKIHISILVILLAFASHPCFAMRSIGVLSTNQTKLPSGQYTGAGQRMILANGDKPHYDDSLNICHMQIEADGSLKADFPDSARPSQFREIHLQFSGSQPRPQDVWADRRDVWIARLKDKTYRAIAIPFSTELYLFRLEIRQNEKLIAGVEQFYGICNGKK